jgi:murein hydrolase activator
MSVWIDVCRIFKQIHGVTSSHPVNSIPPQYFLIAPIKTFQKFQAFGKFLLVIFFAFFLNISQLPAQNKRGELETKRQQLLKQISTTSEKLTEIKQTRTAARDHLETLQGQIENREHLINTLQEEIEETDGIMERTEAVLEALQSDIERLRTEYALMMRKAYTMKVPNNSLLFLLSSNSFSDAYKRWQYFQQYDKFRKRQAKMIEQTKLSLTSKNQELETRKTQKILLLGTNEQQKYMLSTEKQDKDKLVQEMRDEEQRLASNLKSQEKQNAKLNTEIERMIVAELENRRIAAETRARKARDEAERLSKERAKEKKRAPKESQIEVAKEPIKSEVLITETSESLALSSDFRSNKGKLPPPATGSIVRFFGRQKVLDKVTAVNNGIDIRTETNADVKVVFTGTVQVVSNIAGLGYVVIVQHGNYYSVYSNMASAWVKKDDNVTTRQSLGKVGINTVSNEPELHFEIWLEKTHLNPAGWLGK